MICRGPTRVCSELDISSYFDSIVRKQLIEMVERRVSDASILRLIGKWINVGVVDDGRLLTSETGPVQGRSSAHCWPTSTFIMCSICGSRRR